MKLGYKLMLLFFVLAYIAGLIFFHGISWIKYLGFAPLLASLIIALKDKEKFDPELGTVVEVLIFGIIADFLPLILWVTVQGIIK